MLDTVKEYMNVILVQRDWSWTLIGIVYLIVGFLIRGLFLRPVIVQAKGLSREVYSEIKKSYLRQSFPGWIFFMISLVIFMVVWNRAPVFPVTVQKALFVLAAVASYVLSILLHLKAFALATIAALKQAIERGMPREF